MRNDGLHPIFGSYKAGGYGGIGICADQDYPQKLDMRGLLASALYPTQYPSINPNIMEAENVLSSLWNQWRRLTYLRPFLFFKSYCRRQIMKVSKATPPRQIESHAYLTGKTGSGKSSRLLQRVYAQRRKSRKTENCSIIFLDPHGDTVEMIRRFDLAQKYPERLVYVDPCLAKGYTPILNPLECGDTDSSLIELQAQQVASAFESMIPDATLSANMKALLLPCLYVMLRCPDSNLSDLQALINGKNQRFLQAGCVCGIPYYERFFLDEFDNPHYNRTKASLSTKLQGLLNSQVFYHMTTARSTVNIDQYVDQGKIILFNLSKGTIGEEVCETIGRFIIAQVKSLAFRRAKLPPKHRKKVYLIIDEADTFLSKDATISTILKEARKYRVHLILATQNLVSDADNTQLKRNLLNNTNTKIIGMNGITTLKPLAQETNIPLQTLQGLRKHQFRVRSGAQGAKKCHTSDVFHNQSPLLLGKKEVKQQTDYLINQSQYYKKVVGPTTLPEELTKVLTIDPDGEPLNQPKPRFTR